MDDCKQRAIKFATINFKWTNKKLFFLLNCQLLKKDGLISNIAQSQSYSSITKRYLQRERE